ncbi:hypothetical cytosolic protein [Syntrophus aciditrophicus SB]|uniref:Hypothetical cytosolic protein n=1 Tax=Syntrophus aciditrophicus (strain SB) TaxID=56780 RepID=Q2LXM0_SYNAS|nr:hypothetical cytosolic protein [Syntrophus aciditrophicus SB]
MTESVISLLSYNEDRENRQQIFDCPCCHDRLISLDFPWESGHYFLKFHRVGAEGDISRGRRPHRSAAPLPEENRNGRRKFEQDLKETVCSETASPFSNCWVLKCASMPVGCCWRFW